MTLAVTILMMAAACSSDNGDHAEPAAITLVKTIPGGCNNMGFVNQKSAAAESSDTLIFSIRKDTLVMFTGINYICCAPFRTEHILLNDSLIVTLTDQCNYPQENCYCRCMCYYTWEFLFTGFPDGTNPGFRVILDDPRQKEPVTLFKGSVTF